MMNNFPTQKQLRDFGLLVGIGFPLLIGWIIPLFTGHGLRTWTFWVGIPFLCLSFLAPNALKHPYRLWMFTGKILGFINSHLILGLVFLIVVQPIALIMRTFGYDPLKKKKRGAPTYREKRETSEIDLTRIF